MKKKFLGLTAMAVMSVMVVSGAAAIGATSVAAASSGVAGAGPIIRDGGGSTHGLPTVASNWSGYAITETKNTPFTYVSSTFIQPTVTCSGSPDLSTSNWVGLDGFNNDTVEQDGTGVNCKRDDPKVARYYAWIEMYPLNSVTVFAVSPGDKIKASVSATPAGVFTLTVADLTKNLSKSVVSTCTSCARASAEWIIERPAGCNQSETKCFLFALPDFGTTTMSDNVATVQGGSPQNLSSFTNAYPIFMIQPDKKGFVTLDVTSAVASNGSFSETWERQGKVTPIQL